jgi:hypothetical protein
MINFDQTSCPAEFWKNNYGKLQGLLYWKGLSITEDQEDVCQDFALNLLTYDILPRAIESGHYQQYVSTSFLNTLYCFYRKKFTNLDRYIGNTELNV